MKKLFTSESVTEGHPDKVCDRISDAILDEVLKEDPTGRVACETCITTGMVFITGEISIWTLTESPAVHCGESATIARKAALTQIPAQSSPPSRSSPAIFRWEPMTVWAELVTKV